MSTAGFPGAGGLELDDLVLRFGGHTVLDHVLLDVSPGTIHAMIGPNGAGKSTLFSVIAGEHSLNHGRVVLDGRDITRYSAHRRVQIGVARAFQVAHIFPNLAVVDNVVSAALAQQRHAHRLWPSSAMRTARDLAHAALDEIGLAALANVQARHLSQGDRKRLEIAVTLQLRPRVLLLDEPTAGMSPEETVATVELIRQVWRRSGLTVLLTEHDMNVVFGLAQRLTVLTEGRVLATGDPDKVSTRADVRDVYLGRGHEAE
ncbi:MAG: ABC transporter ATP-binding protein [Acetobacteraceae bacterium]